MWRTNHCLICLENQLGIPHLQSRIYSLLFWKSQKVSAGQLQFYYIARVFCLLIIVLFTFCNDEYADIYFVRRFCNGKAPAAVAEYMRRIPVGSVSSNLPSIILGKQKAPSVSLSAVHAVNLETEAGGCYCHWLVTLHLHPYLFLLLFFSFTSLPMSR
jgi:hypothetical protein